MEHLRGYRPELGDRYIPCMRTAGAERYREHGFWELLRARLEELRAASFEDPSLESERIVVIEVLETIQASSKNPVPWIYEPVLNSLTASLGNLVVGEGEFAIWVSSTYFINLKDDARQLPAPRPRDIGDAYLAALDRAIQFRQIALKDIEARAVALSAEVAAIEDQLVALKRDGDARLKGLAAAVEEQSRKIAADAATISQVTLTAGDQARTEWTNELNAWNLEREAKDQESDAAMATQLLLLTGSAQVGERLVEYAAGKLTARSWSARHKRERLNAIWLRWGAILAYVLAVATGGWLVWWSITKEQSLDVGDGILRGAVVIALGAIGTFLISESRRHFREAASAEEVSLALTAVEPFYASSDAGARDKARAQLGDTIFIKNVVSRFAGRDASKHNANQELSEVIEQISKGTDAFRKLGGTGER